MVDTYEDQVVGYAVFDQQTGHWKAGQFSFSKQPAFAIRELLNGITGIEKDEDDCLFP